MEALVVGGDSLVGKALVAELAGRGHQVFETTRRKESTGPRRLLLDLAVEHLAFIPPPPVRRAFLVAAATGYERCETDPLAYRINVDNMARLARSLLAARVGVTFVSTNTVFGGERPFCAEDDAISPGITYAKHKAAAEQAIAQAARLENATRMLQIVRLTKVLTASTSPLPAWLAQLARGEPIRPFADFVFCPISLAFAATGLAQIGASEHSGFFHLSGARDVDYVEFARTVIAQRGLSERLCEPTTSAAAGISIQFLPKYSGIGMTRTTRLTGIEPQPLTAVVQDVLRAAAQPA